MLGAIPAKATAYDDGATKEHAKRIMGLVMADNPIDKKAT